jgi:hypothetical protein
MLYRLSFVLFVLVLIQLITFCCYGQGHPLQTDGALQNPAFNVSPEPLYKLLILAFLLETGLAIVFNYRWFLYYFDGLGVKTPISFFVSLAFVSAYKIDIVSDYITVVNPEYPSLMKFSGYVITALIVSGGSNVIFNLFKKLGLRAPTARQKSIEEMKRLCLYSVILERKNVEVETPVSVLIDDEIVGTIRGGKNRLPSKWYKSI